MKPNVLTVEFSNIPNELKRLNRWVLWKFVEVGDEGEKRWAKLPMQTNARPASSSNPQTWTDWLQLRKSKKAAVTETVLAGARKEAQKLNWSLEQFLVEWCTRGSQGLKAEWLKEKLSVSEQRQNTMSQLTRGMSVPKQPFWAKPETIVLEAEDVERKRLL